MPPGWSRIRAAVLARDKRKCQAGTYKCTGRATEVDHLGDPDDHRLEMLQSVCRECHQVLGGQRSAAKRKAKGRTRVRPPERHPSIRYDD